MATIRQSSRILEAHPQAGRRLAGIPGDLYRLVIRFGRFAYLMMYSYDGQKEVILRVRHSREAGF